MDLYLRAFLHRRCKMELLFLNVNNIVTLLLQSFEDHKFPLQPDESVNNMIACIVDHVFLQILRYRKGVLNDLLIAIGPDA